MKISPNFKVSCKFFEQLPKKRIPGYVKISKTLAFVRERLGQMLYGISNDRMWEIYKKKLFNRVQSFSFFSKKNLRKAFSEDFFLSLAKKQFDPLIRKTAILYFQKKINSQDETLESVQNLFQSTGEDITAVLEGARCEEIISVVSLEKLSTFAKETPLKEQWQDLLAEMKYFFTLSTISIQERCEQKFLEMFSSKQLKAPGSWKLSFAKHLVSVKEENLPEFAKVKLRELRADLPVGFDERVLVWQKGQVYLETVAAKKIQKVKDRVFYGFDLPVMSSISDQELTPRYVVEKTASIQAYKFSELMPSIPESDSDDFLLSYLSGIIEIQIIEHCFVKYQGRISEEAFLKAYEAWDKFAKDPTEFDELVEAKINEAQNA